MPEDLAMKWLRLRKEVEEAQREADRAEGALNELAKQMVETHGVDDVQELETEIKKLLDEKNKLGFLMQEKVNAFQKKWAERLK